TITHLPQVAVKGETHYKVFKQDSVEATFTSIKRLDDEERVREIAGMLSGEAIDEAALNNAKSLLGKR
ncbi:MAG: DNA repair protein RecN, partial [Bacteroidales bacterium]|nr:DNA repair protein RecN [Bacteroidales bacterium]